MGGPRRDDLLCLGTAVSLGRCVDPDASPLARRQAHGRCPFSPPIHGAAGPRQGKTAWLVAAVVTPMLAMFLMWPSEYALFERSPLLHATQHLGLVGLGFLTGYAGQRFAAGIGVVASLSVLLMGLLAIGGYGTSPPASVVSPAVVSLAQNHASGPDAARGSTIFAQNCAACHGARGQGGVGPALIGESARKNFVQAVRWIKHPNPPMPALYPQTLNERDVRDVAAFVEALK